MANIQPEIDDFRNAIYGEEVRESMISLAEKLNDEVEAGTDNIEQYEADITQAISDATDGAAAANSAATAATSAASSANTAASNANTARTQIEANESARQSAETARATAETARAAAEPLRVSAEQQRAAAELARVSAEASRAAAEQNRATAESDRGTAEATRVSNEATRVGSESARVSAEGLRQSNETARVNAETERQRAFNNMAQQILPPATKSTLGGLIVGDGLDVDSSGKVDVIGAGDLETGTHAAATYATKTELAEKANASHVHAGSDITSGSVAVAQGGTGATTASGARENLGIEPLTTSEIDTVVADGTLTSIHHLNGTILTYLWGKLKTKFASLASGVVAVSQGGTGAATHTSNAVLTGNGTSAVNNVATADGALYATAADGAPQFGTLPVAQGGTGATTAAAARTGLSVPSKADLGNVAASVAPVEQSTATANHAVGSYLILDNVLYKVTTAIATGETIAEGTNVTATDLNTELGAIQNSLSKPIDWTYVDNVYWWGGTWTVPDNGFIEVNVTPSAANWYWYISDSKAPITTWSHCLEGGTPHTSSRIFLVKKGAVLGTSQMGSVSSAKVFYYRLSNILS